MTAQTTLEQALQATHDGPIWSAASEQLNANVLRFRTGDGVAPHVNNEVDVLMMVVAGTGELLLGETWQPVAAGQIVLIERGTQRAVRCDKGELVYLACHRRRPGLMPTMPETKQVALALGLNG